MQNQIISALLAIIGVAVGASIQYLFARRTETAKRYSELRSQAYVDFLRAVVGLTLARKSKDTQKELESLIFLTDAKSRIAVYGSTDVIESIAHVFRDHPVLDTPEAVNSYVRMIQKMRAETTGTNKWANDSDIRQLLFEVE